MSVDAVDDESIPCEEGLPAPGERIMKRVSPEALERVARLYHTNAEAAAALGMTMRGFGRRLPGPGASRLHMSESAGCAAPSASGPPRTCAQSEASHAAGD